MILKSTQRLPGLLCHENGVNSLCVDPCFSIISSPFRTACTESTGRKEGMAVTQHGWQRVVLAGSAVDSTCYISGTRESQRKRDRDRESQATQVFYHWAAFCDLYYLQVIASFTAKLGTNQGDIIAESLGNSPFKCPLIKMGCVILLKLLRWHW